MTMPSERTRALRWAGEFLAEARRHPGLPVELARQIPGILRHYPSTDDMRHEAKYGSMPGFETWLAPEEGSTG